MIDEQFYKEEIRCGYKVSAEMKQIWAVQLDLIEKFKVVCEKYDLRYFMQSGTLLGAVRHQGFIPWDDDADFMMLREDFEKLKEIATEEFKAPYFFQTLENEPNIFNKGKAMLRRSDTTGIQERRNLYHKGNQGIGIDINIIDKVYSNEHKRKQQQRKVDRYESLLFINTYRKDIKGLKLLNLNSIQTMCIYILSKALKREMLCKKLNQAFQMCKEESPYVTIFSQTLGNYREHIYYAEDFADSIMMPFEHLLLPAPIGYKRLLKTDMGNGYMEYPKIDDRKPHHYTIVSPNVSYAEYRRHFTEVFKNMKGKTVVIFGAGKMFEHYFKHYGKRFKPDYITDNDQKKWGQELKGIKIISPKELLTIPKERLHIIICSVYYKEIEKQLLQLGINEYFFYVQKKEWL